MPSTIGSIASRWLGFGGIETTTSIARPPLIARSAPAWYLTSPVQAMSSRKPRDETGSLNSARICAYGLFSTCAMTFSRPRCAMPIRMLRMPDSAASPITSSSTGTSMSSPSIEKRVLPGKRAVEEALERLDLRQPVEERDRADGIGRRAEPPAFGRLPQPLALLGHEHVGVVVARGRAVDPPEARRSTSSMFAAPSASGDGDQRWPAGCGDPRR